MCKHNMSRVPSRYYCQTQEPMKSLHIHSDLSKARKDHSDRARLTLADGINQAAVSHPDVKHGFPQLPANGKGQPNTTPQHTIRPEQIMRECLAHFKHRQQISKIRMFCLVPIHCHSMETSQPGSTKLPLLTARLGMPPRVLTPPARAGRLATARRQRHAPRGQSHTANGGPVTGVSFDSPRPDLIPPLTI